ncbi:hypothetical protein RN001_013907 [Aquatica leii]|uniref:Uncharacterized protein n=1 Tax=Aquatica leii TaxID=1421715 RepID=A0AAN7SCL6_9COLE|nr:hypothetical protein RN001_013907 [Aquatica leii]
MLKTLVLVFLSCTLQESLTLITEEYYWKEFRGEVPEDAIEGGKSVNGQPIYIGQVLYFDKLLPAKIYKNDDKAYFAWNHEQSTTNNIKILCSLKPERFKWIPTKKDEIHLLTNFHVICGGTEPNHNLYIGRALYKSETLVGKVRTGEKPAQNSGLSITSEAIIELLNMLRSLIVLLIAFFAIKCDSQRIQQSYYWADFEGLIPEDAIAGGQDENGEAIFIGQVLYGDKLLPAKIYSYDTNAYFAWGVEQIAKENIKILCSLYPERFKWLDTTKDTVHLLINAHLVKGGWDSPYDVYIGRAFHKMQTLVGKIRVGSIPSYNEGLYVTVPGKVILVPSFQILAYDASCDVIVDEETGRCTKNIVVKT